MTCAKRKVFSKWLVYLSSETICAFKTVLYNNLFVSLVQKRNISSYFCTHLFKRHNYLQSDWYPSMCKDPISASKPKFEIDLKMYRTVCRNQLNSYYFHNWNFESPHLMLTKMNDNYDSRRRYLFFALKHTILLVFHFAPDRAICNDTIYTINCDLNFIKAIQSDKMWVICI